MPCPYSRHSALTCSSRRPWVTTQEEHDRQQHQRERRKRAQPRRLRGQRQGIDQLDKVPRYSCSRLVISALATARASEREVLCGRELQDALPVGTGTGSSTITSINRPGGRCRARPAARRLAHRPVGLG